MNALMGRCGPGLFAASAWFVLAGANVGLARTEALAVRLKAEGPAARDALSTGSDFAEYESVGEKKADAQETQEMTADGNPAAFLLPDTVCFNPPNVPPDVPPDTPPIIPPVVPPVIPPDNPPPPDIPPVTPPPDIPPPTTPPPSNSTPEPATLLMGLIGSACAGATVWRRGKDAKSK